MSSGIAPVFKGLVSHPWAYPALEAVHIVGIAMLFGGLLVFELRALGLGRDLPAARLARLTLAPALAGFGLCAATGLAMFAGQPGELLANPAFRLKLLLIEGIALLRLDDKEDDGVLAAVELVRARHRAAQLRQRLARRQRFAERQR